MSTVNKIARDLRAFEIIKEELYKQECKYQNPLSNDYKSYISSHFSSGCDLSIGDGVRRYFTKVMTNCSANAIINNVYDVDRFTFEFDVKLIVDDTVKRLVTKNT